MGDKMTGEQVLQRTINNLSLYNMDALLIDIKYLPCRVSEPIEKAFYKSLKRNGNMRTACRVARRVAKKFIGKV